MILTPIICPCCARPAAAPTFEVLREALLLSPMEAHVLEAVWYGRQWDKDLHPNRKPCSEIVYAETMYDSMYRDDPDGGPSDRKMADALKWTLHHLRKKIVGSGIWVETVGYRRGWRLIITAPDGLAA